MLDTTIVSEMIRNPAGRAAQRARATAEAVCVSVIEAAGLRYGCARKGSPKLLRRVEELLSEVPVLPFDVRADSAYGGIRAELEAAGRPTGSMDLLIAAHASALVATVVTENVGEFRRIRGLNVENWLEYAGRAGSAPGQPARPCATSDDDGNRRGGGRSI
jgi:tRNA(fMet)-specific endonuclease VapC